MTSLADLAALTALEMSGDGAPTVRYAAHVGAEFTIGPKVHGGSLQLVVAVAARRALHDLAAPDSDPALLDGVTALSVSSDYLAAPDPGGIELAVRPVKRGRTVSVLQVDILQRDRVMVSSSVTLGRLDDGDPLHRDTGTLGGLPAEPAADALALEGSVLEEVNHLGAVLDLSLDASSFPAATGATGAPEVRGWTRPKQADRQPPETAVDFPVLVCDISPPVVMNLGMFGWAPTVQLTTYLRRRPAPGWLRFAASSTEVGRSMFAEDHLVLDSTGAVVAQSRQLALIPHPAR